MEANWVGILEVKPNIKAKEKEKVLRKRVFDISFARVQRFGFCLVLTLTNLDSAFRLCPFCIVAIHHFISGRKIAMT